MQYQSHTVFSLMQHLILVFIGSGLGGCTRYLLGKWVQAQMLGNFPWGTLCVNMMACLVLGFVMGILNKASAWQASALLLLASGFCGGFSTFSTFSFETLQLLEQKQYLDAFINIMASVSVCIVSVFLGLYCGKWMS